MDHNAPVHLILLEFADRASAGEHLEGHNAWIDQGFADDVFLMTGTVPGRGGAVLVQHEAPDELSVRVGQDPFVAHGVVSPQIIEIVPSRVHPRLEAATDD